jgi:hypothetical protein
MSLKKKLLLYGIKSILNIPSRFTNWFQIRVLRNHLKYKLVGNFSDNLDLAIFVLYPGTTPLNSVVRVITSLKLSGYQVLLVVNRNTSTDEWIENLSNETSHILIRENIGSDFGAYKASIHYLQKSGLYDQLENLVLINDSIYFTLIAMEVLKEIVKPSNSVNCVFLHRQDVVHAASTLVKFDKKILGRSEFKNFWKNYYPYSAKNQIIRKGEHMLTVSCGSNYFNPFVKYENLRERHEVVNMKSAERLQLIKWANRTLGLSFGEFELYLETMPDDKLIEYGIFNFQVSNALGLYLARVYKIPIKLDLVKLNLIQISDYKEFLEGEDVLGSEIGEVLRIIAAKGSSLSTSYLERIIKGIR